MKKIVSVFLALVLVFSFAATASARLVGDVNSDGKTNSTDALLILKYAVGLDEEINTVYADVDNNDIVNSGDALAVLKISVGSYEGDLEVEDEDDSTREPNSKAEVIKFFNAETAKAAKGSYKVTRTGKFTKPINVGSLTNALNSIIAGVDKNENLDSVVGGFLGIGATPITGVGDGGKYEGFDEKYAMKAMKLTEADVVDFAVSGNTYRIKIKDCTTPDANSAIARATNDYITYDEVNKTIAEAVGHAVKIIPEESSAKYSNIIFTATVVDGKITTLEYSYTLDASLKIKLAIPSAMGTGQATISGKYTEIKY